MRQTLSNRCRAAAALAAVGAAVRQRFDTAAIFGSAREAVPIPVLHAVAFTAVRQGLTRGSRSSEWSSSTRFRK